MSFADLVQATKTALLSDPAQAQAKFEAHHDLVGPCEVTVTDTSSRLMSPRPWEAAI